MTAPSAFRCEYADWRVILGRKVIRISFEIPIEAEAEAYQVLGGMPDPSRSQWCAVARLTKETAKPSPADPPARELPAKRKWHELSYPQRIGIRCNDERFQEFLFERGKLVQIDDEPKSEQAAAAIRAHCGVGSRSEILPGTVAGDQWELLDSEFQLYERQVSDVTL